MKGVLSVGQQKLKKLKERQRKIKRQCKTGILGRSPGTKEKGNFIFDRRLEDNSPVQEINRYFTNLGVCRLQLILSSLQMTTFSHDAMKITKLYQKKKTNPKKHRQQNLFALIVWRRADFFFFLFLELPLIMSMNKLHLN